MRKTDPPGQLQNGFELSPAPPIGPDGAPIMTNPRAPLPARPRLCEAGPCVHYHCLEIQVDAEDPRSRKVPVRLPVLGPGMEAVPDGTLYRAPAVFHTATEHYCYPDLGIEMALGPTPVVQCNRWVPKYTDHNGHELVLRTTLQQQEFWTSPQGQQYASAVEAWETAREREAREAEQAEQEIAEALAAQEELAHIDALVEQYTYRVTTTTERTVHSDGARVYASGCVESVATCVEVPSVSAADVSETAALAALRDILRSNLITWSRLGHELPRPTGSDPPTTQGE